MNPIRSLFQRKPRGKTREIPQNTLHERRALELPGTGSPLTPAAIEEMESDAMIQTSLRIKKLAVLAADWQIVPASDTASARRNAEFARQSLEAMRGSIRTALMQVMDAFSTGWSIQEIVLVNQGGNWQLQALKPKDPHAFGLKTDPYGNLEGLIYQPPSESPLELATERFVIYFHQADPMHPKGRSDLESAWKHFVAKRSLVTAWRAHLERFASPTVLGRYARGLPTDEQAGILSALKGLHENTAIVFPNEIEISTLHGRESDNNAFQEAIEFHNREMARAILGQTLTTDEGRRVGSLALGKVHLQVLLLQIDAIRRELADAVVTEQILRPLIEWNFGPGEIPRFEFISQPLEAFVSGSL